MISRHEIEAELEDFIKTSSKLLKPFGSLYMVHRPERLTDIIVLMRNYKLEPKILRMVHPKPDTEPNLILIKAVKEAKPFLKVAKPLIVYEKENKYTAEILKIYHKEMK